MADSILRLKVESQEYDQKIKRAAEGIQQYAQKCREVGGTLTKLDDGVLEFVQALGQMDTVATGTKQQLREMSNALTTLTQTYRGLTDEEKASPFGQEMAKGIQQITERAGQMRDAMDDVNLSIKNVASDTATFDQIAGAANIATSGFQVLQGATKILGIEMGDNVEIIAKLQAAMAVTNGLSQIQAALQKQSAFMQGVMAAKTALATVAQQAYAVATGEATAAQVALNAAMAVNPYAWVVIAIGAVVAQTYAFIEAINKTIEAGGELGDVIKNSMISPIYAYMVASDEAEEKQKQWQQSLKDTKTIVDDLANSFNILKEAMKLSGASDKDLYHAEYESLLKQRSELKKQLENKDLPHDEWQKIADQIKEVNKAMGELNQKRKTYLDQVVKLKNPSYVNSLNTEREINAAIGIARSERGQNQMGSVNWNYWNDLETNLKNRLPKTSTVTPKTSTVTPMTTANTNNGKVKVQTEPEFITGPPRFNEETISAWTSMIKDQLSKADFGTELYNNLTDNLSDMSRLTTTIQDAIKLGLDIPQDQVQRMYEEVFDQNNLPEGMYDDMIEKFIEDFKIKTGKDLKIGSDGKLTEGNEGKQSESDNDKEEEKYFTTEFSKLSGGLSGFQSGLKQLGIDLGDGFGSVVSGLQGIASILTAIQTIVGAIEAVSQISAFWPLAGGGIIKAAGGTLVGDSYSGDNLRGIGPGGQIYGLNAGEIVLNRAQAGVLAAELSSGNDGGGVAQPYVSGQYIFLGTNNYLKASGQGEIVTTKMLKRYGLV